MRRQTGGSADAIEEMTEAPTDCRLAGEAELSWVVSGAARVVGSAAGAEAVACTCVDRLAPARTARPSCPCHARTACARPFGGFLNKDPRRCPSKVVDEGNIAPLEGWSGDDESAGTFGTAQYEIVELSVVEVVECDGVTVVTFR